jgi:hypothetical protein
VRYAIANTPYVSLISESRIKRARRDLNPRPTEPESVALSTELRALTLRYYIILIQYLNVFKIHPCIISKTQVS